MVNEPVVLNISSIYSSTAAVKPTLGGVLSFILTHKALAAYLYIILKDSFYTSCRSSTEGL